MPFNSPTEKQIKYIHDLGGSLPENATMADASNIIDTLLNSRPTNRQIMVLRFWNRLDLINSGVDGVSEWMTEFYNSNPVARQAWELWKEENRDEGSKSNENIDKVEIGIGYKYLEKCKGDFLTKNMKIIIIVFIVVSVIILFNIFKSP